MKPGDHPEFFERPPPLGRSRESSIVLDRDGQFWHEGAPITHRAMAVAFAAWIGRHPRDGRFILSNGYDWSYFTVEDVPYFVRAVRGEPEGAPILELSDGSEEAMDPATVTLGEHEDLYVRVKAGGAFEARFTRAAQLGLAPWVAEQGGEGGEAVLRVEGRAYRIERRASRG